MSPRPAGALATAIAGRGGRLRLVCQNGAIIRVSSFGLSGFALSRWRSIGTQPRMQCLQALLVRPARLQGGRQIVVPSLTSIRPCPSRAAMRLAWCGSSMAMLVAAAWRKWCIGTRRVNRLAVNCSIRSASLTSGGASVVDPEMTDLGRGRQARAVDLEIAPQPGDELPRQGKFEVGGVLEVAWLEVQREAVAVRDQMPVQDQVGEGAPAQRAGGQQCHRKAVAVGDRLRRSASRRNPASTSRMASRPDR